MPEAIVVQGLSKQFSRFHHDKPVTLQESLLRGWHRLKPIDRFWALQDVTFSIAAGRMVGLIGRNGSGKSTLLRLIGGIGRPDTGKIKTYGRIGALLDLGVGLHPDLTGRENIFVSGVVSGLTRAEVRKQFDSIVAFAELEQFIDSPLRTYSAGMQMRLGFAIAVHTSPDILLIDEVLAVGDLAFQRKCLERVHQFKENGCAIILVAHDEAKIKQLCDDVMYLRNGRLVAYGNPEITVEQYVADIQQETERRTPTSHSTLKTSDGIELKLNENRFGSMEMEITSVRLLNVAGLPIRELTTGDSLRIEIAYRAPKRIPSPILSVTITREDKLVCYATNTAKTEQPIPFLQDEGTVTLQLDHINLNSGQYCVNVGVYKSDWSYAYDCHWYVYPFQIRQTGFEEGIISLPHRWEIEQPQTMRSSR